ncbi:putative acyltransferase [Dysgonomonas hofstadii]|uniref:Putative acyltransferase n=1 Tax=Dysgonomonas hofstadii TaxID=637886 RepID=A0A840CMR1_9BACT|nr:DUF5009 domain-containing protein [Dysgonomonas hofstadii]MBB4034285.1 putative acyltransferase [Dysgonomonas hofstadii]
MNEVNTGFTQRNVAIDILRALTMLLMIFVNDLWSIKGEPDWLGHAEYDQDMLGLADVVFPCFLFVVGMSIPYAIERRFSKGLSGVSTVAHVLTRSLALLLMGVFIVNSESGVSEVTGLNIATYRILMVAAFFLIWNVYPKTEKKQLSYLFTVLKIAGILILLYLAVVFRDGEGGVFKSRWWGILGLIGWTYLVCAFTYLFTRDRLKYLIPVWLILIIWCILKSKMIDGTAILSLRQGNFLDQMVSILHLGNGALPALTMGGIILSVIGVKYINTGNKKKLIMAGAAIVILFAAGFISHKFWIISKVQETPPWVFYCIAISITTYVLLYWLVEKGKASWFNIIKPAGTATLTCYLIPYILYSIFYLTSFHLPDTVTTYPVGIVKCIVFSFLTIGVTALLNKVGVKLKI